jgi:hypothetical protein
MLERLRDSAISLLISMLLTAVIVGPFVLIQIYLAG